MVLGGVNGGAGAPQAVQRTLWFYTNSDSSQWFG